jgi:hypothetical protein
VDDQTVNEITDQHNAELQNVDLTDIPTVESVEGFIPTEFTPTEEVEAPTEETKAQASPTLVVGKFRKKPVEIEAIQFTAYNVPEVREFLGDAAVQWMFYHTNTNIQCGEFDYPREEITSVVDIQTPSGVVVSTSHVGDWILKGVEGEFYPCKDSIFRASYEEAPDGE